MNSKIMFVNLTKFHSKKNNQDYFQITYIDLDNKCSVTEFITEEDYIKYEKMRIEFLKQGLATFGLNQNRQTVLKDIKF